MGRPSLRQLEYAIAVDDHGSFSRAAAALFVSQPALSAQIAELERRLGVALFERRRRTCPPTSAGLEILPRARDIILLVDDIVRAAGHHAGTLAGPVRVAAIPTVAPYLLSTVARELRHSWPDAELELLELRTEQLVEALSTGAADVGLLAMPVETASLHVVDVAFEPFTLAVAESHPYAASKEITASHLAETDILLLEDGHCLGDHALTVCRLAGARRHRTIHQASLPVLTQLVAGGDEATLLPISAVPVETRPGSGVTAIPMSDRTWGRRLALAWRSSDPRAGTFDDVVPSISDAIRSTLAG